MLRFACICAVVATAIMGCRKVPSQATPPSADQLWQQGCAAAHARDGQEAADLFVRSIELDDTPDRRRRAAVLVAVAGRCDLAYNFVVACEEPSLRAMAKALQLYDQSPPIGHADNPYVLTAMAEAIQLIDQAAVEPVPVRPVVLAATDLAKLMRHWQRWVALARIETGEAQEPNAADAAPLRAVAAWICPKALAGRAIDAGLIAQPAEGADSEQMLAHLGGWPLAQSGPADDVAALAAADIEAAQPINLVLGVRDGEQWAAGLLLAGTVTSEGVVVTATDEPQTLEALLALLGDETLTPGRIDCRDEAQYQRILTLAGRMGLAGRVLTGSDAGGWTLMVAETADGDTQSDATGLWLAELAGYVRYGGANGGGEK